MWIIFNEIFNEILHMKHRLYNKCFQENLCLWGFKWWIENYNRCLQSAFSGGFSFDWTWNIYLSLGGRMIILLSIVLYPVELATENYVNTKRISQFRLNMHFNRWVEPQPTYSASHCARCSEYLNTKIRTWCWMWDMC